MNKILSFIIVLSLLNSCNYVNYQQGQDLYKTNCATCHMPDGSGVNELYPSLNNLDQNSFNLSEMPCIIRNGLGNELSLIQMSGLEHLSEVEINNIVNYVLNDMNNLSLEFTIQQTEETLKDCSE